MEEKRASGIGVVIVILVIAIAVICAMGYYIYTTSINESTEIATLKTKLNDVQSQNDSYKDTINKITEALNENTKQEEKKEEEKKEELVKEETKKEYEDIILDGAYSFPNSDAPSESFTKDGKVYTAGEASALNGTYRTIAPGIIEINYTKKKEYLSATEEKISDINEYVYYYYNNGKLIGLDEYLVEKAGAIERIADSFYEDID